MKKILPLVVCLVMTARLFAQDCSAFVYMKKGKIIETTTFSGDGTVMSKHASHILDVTTSNGTTSATAEVENFDRNGASTSKSTVTYKCNGGTFFFDMNAMGNRKGVKFSATNMEYPGNLKVGDHLKDVDIKMEMSSMTVNAKITNRQVVSKESVTTPAGTWTALKITYQTKVDMPNMPAGMGTQSTTEWYVPNFGIVQWELGMGMSMKITSIR
jgi:hypothetical protein